MATPVVNNPTTDIQLNMNRLDFGSALFPSVPMSFWQTRLGYDPSKWPDESLTIRKEYEDTLAKAGYPFRISTDAHRQVIGDSPANNPLERLIEAALQKARDSYPKNPPIADPIADHQARMMDAAANAAPPSPLQSQMDFNNKRLAELDAIDGPTAK